MRIVSRVAAAFYRPDRTPIFEVTARDLLVIMDAPEEIRSDPLFSMLVKEGSLQVITSEEARKELEADPVQGTNAEGRMISAPTIEPDSEEQQDSLPLKQGEVAEGRRGSAPTKGKTSKSA